MGPLEGKIAVVTGASRGIGRAIALRLAAEGARVGVNYHRGADAAEETVALIRERGGEAQALPFDVGDPAMVKESLDTFIRAQGGIDILVNNAGLVHNGLLVRLKPEEVDRLFSVNVGGVIHCTRAAAAAMMKARSGRIVNLTSVVAESGNAGQALYASTKAAILGFTRSVARELAPRRITVNAVAPGFIDTDMTSDLPEATRAGILESIPLGRIGSPDEVAATVSFLTLPESGYITGQVLHVNGGMYM